MTRPKRTCRIVNLDVLPDHRIKLKESETRDKYSDLGRELKKKTMKHEGGEDISCNRCSRNNPQGISKETGALGNKAGIIKISQITKESPADLRRLAVTQTPLENHQLIIIIIISYQGMRCIIFSGIMRYRRIS